MSTDVVMEDWQRRVIEERTDLETKLYHLNAFMQSPKFTIIAYEEQSRLTHQKETMIKYAQALTHRIANFSYVKF